MNQLKETREEKRTRKEERKENLLLQNARELLVDNSVDNAKTLDALHHAWERCILTKDLLDAARKIGMSAAELRAWLAYMEDVGWTLKGGDKVNSRNFRRPLRMWHVIGLDRAARHNRTLTKTEREAKRREEEAKRKREAIAKDPKSWILCQERCANYIPGQGCKCGVKIPPAHQERQIPPEDCPHFISNGEEAV